MSKKFFLRLLVLMIPMFQLSFAKAETPDTVLRQYMHAVKKRDLKEYRRTSSRHGKTIVDVLSEAQSRGFGDPFKTHDISNVKIGTSTIRGDVAFVRYRAKKNDQTIEGEAILFREYGEWRVDDLQLRNVMGPANSEKYWRRKITLCPPGTSRAEVEKILPPGSLETGWNGDIYYRKYRLDAGWKAYLEYNAQFKRDEIDIPLTSLLTKAPELLYDPWQREPYYSELHPEAEPPLVREKKWVDKFLKGPHGPQPFSPNVKSADGWLFHIAAARDGMWDTFEKLMLMGAEPNARSEREGMTALIAASCADPKSKDHLRIAKYLAYNRADVNLQDNDGRTALMNAVEYNNEVLVLTLLNNRADRSKKNKIGETALSIAERNKNDWMVYALKQ